MSSPEKKKVVGNYEVGKPLGKGSFSSVRFCKDVRNGKEYAMKILDKQDLVDKKMGAQVNREIALMLKMTHRNVCAMRECFQTSEKVFLILELVTGGDLFQRIKAAGKLPEDEARDLFQQLICGLHYCHKHGIAHRDLKPENLLLNQDGMLKISDFGLSNTQSSSDSGRVGPSQMLKTVCGTPNYVAPEVLKNEGYNGFQADMWSAGVILYVMLSGKLPFHDKQVHFLFRKIQEGEYVIPEFFGPDVVALLKHLICTDPITRYTCEQVTTDPWFRVNWDPSRFEDGELVPTPSQEQIKDTITQLREQREQKEAEGSPKPAVRAAPKVKKPRSSGAVEDSAPTNHMAPPPSSEHRDHTETDAELARKRKEIEELNRQRADMDRQLEQRRRELAALNTGR
eukprot:NODE_2319_length_1450_cov_37.614921_g2203_i0.p1 GENE.NODE_2319_length_1450_cov_37.614921_g2203_i0~~NODE_2319_length_1450_cov_37.614921_g2203_i0.p1  ORF type:complete len:417 (+),score=68.54 NODE_2319_length_1450_cov_37.614921_g2203_i0:58-1251(+)